MLVDAFLLSGAVIMATSALAIRQARGRERVLAIARCILTCAPSIACTVVTIVGVSRGFANGEATLPLVLTSLLGLFGALVPFPLIGGMLSLALDRPMRWLIGAGAGDDPQTF